MRLFHAPASLVLGYDVLQPLPWFIHVHRRLGAFTLSHPCALRVLLQLQFPPSSDVHGTQLVDRESKYSQDGSNTVLKKEDPTG